jgi:hypothetical protein
VENEIPELFSLRIIILITGSNINAPFKFKLVPNAFAKGPKAEIGP